MKKAILVAVSLQKTVGLEENMEEMKELAHACDIEISEVIIQNLTSVHRQLYVNTGKMDEIRIRAEEADIPLLIFNQSLSPSQLRHIVDASGCEVMDKSDLILNIFSQRAKSKEALLQVECARLKYTLPRLSGSYESMDRQRGGGAKNRGTGEKKMEVDARRIESRIHALEKELKDIQTQRLVQRRLRDKNEVKSAALVGYTNAGKSSIMNGCMAYLDKDDKKVFEKDMLFATLTTQIRNITLESNNSFTLSDTVGFISDLPHTLVQAFTSTLEEATSSNLLIEVVDASNPEHESHMKVCKETLQSIQCNNDDTLYVFNKCDLAKIPYPRSEENCLYICAKEEESIVYLLQEIERRLYQRHTLTLLIPYEKGALIHELNTHTQVHVQDNTEEGVRIELSIRDEYLEKVQPFIV